MGQQNTSLMLSTYITDFGTTFTNIPIKFSAEAPIPDSIYAARTDNCSGGGIGFSPRHLVAEFSTGKYKYPVSANSSILTVVTALISAGATCVDLVGEKWSNVPTTQLNAPAFKTTPFAASAIGATGDKETGKFDYVSEVYGTQRLGYAVESENSDLLAAGKAGLSNPEIGGLNSRPSNVLIKPRHLKIISLVDNDTTINRKAMISSLGSLTSVADTIAPQAYYFAYQGESARRLQDI